MPPPALPSVARANAAKEGVRPLATGFWLLATQFIICS